MKKKFIYLSLLSFFNLFSVFSQSVEGVNPADYTKVKSQIDSTGYKNLKDTYCYGDFDGNGTNEYAFLEHRGDCNDAINSPGSISQDTTLEDLNELKNLDFANKLNELGPDWRSDYGSIPCDEQIVFTDKSIPKIGFGFSYISNAGDLDGNGTDEILLINAYGNGTCMDNGFYEILSFYEKKWQTIGQFNYCGRCRAIKTPSIDSDPKNFEYAFTEGCRPEKIKNSIFFEKDPKKKGNIIIRYLDLTEYEKNYDDEKIVEAKKSIPIIWKNLKKH